MQRKSSLLCGLLSLFLVLLASCGKEPDAQDVTTDLSLQAIPEILQLAEPQDEVRKPSAMLGAFFSLYLAESDTLDTKSAIGGVKTLTILLGLQEETTTEELYALISELGQLLQVDVSDTLNRSEHRPETLNTYMESLITVGTGARKRQIELEALLDQKRDEQAEQRKVVTSIERAINTALKDEEYATAGSKQPLLQEERQKLSTIENSIERTRETERTLTKLLAIAEARALAIEQNREVLIAGLKVVDLPGIDDLGILEEVRTRDFPSPFGEEP